MTSKQELSDRLEQAEDLIEVLGEELDAVYDRLERLESVLKFDPVAFTQARLDDSFNLVEFLFGGLLAPKPKINDEG